MSVSDSFCTSSVFGEQYRVLSARYRPGSGNMRYDEKCTIREVRSDSLLPPSQASEPQIARDREFDLPIELADEPEINGFRRCS